MLQDNIKSLMFSISRSGVEMSKEKNIRLILLFRNILLNLMDVGCIR
jgi:hypothetical protein